MALEDDDRDEDKRTILERRRRFVVSAISGLSIALATSCDGEPQPCLDFAPPGGGGMGGAGGEGGAGGTPQPCLDMPPPGGGGMGGAGGEGGAGGSGGAR